MYIIHIHYLLANEYSVLKCEPLANEYCVLKCELVCFHAVETACFHAF